jgi:uncharacterized protein (DUF1697 family)
MSKMTPYVMLLRGINVGTAKRIRMTDLAHSCEQAGARQVYTYIASGNAYFSHEEHDVQKLTRTLEARLRADFDMDIPVLLLEASTFLAIADAIPKHWENDGAQKSDVLFLWPELDVPATLTELGHDPEIETCMYIPGALLWHIERTLQSRSVLMAKIGTKWYRNTTVRNVRTVRALATRLREHAQGA